MFPRLAAELCAALAESHADLAQVIPLRPCCLHAACGRQQAAGSGDLAGRMAAQLPGAGADPEDPAVARARAPDNGAAVTLKRRGKFCHGRITTEGVAAEPLRPSAPYDESPHE